MKNIFLYNFNDPFPSLYPHYQSCNGNFDTDKPNLHSANFPLYEKEIANILSYRTMKVRMAKTIGSIKKMMRELLAAVSLLFGMCSSQPCFILDAFCGATLYRFPFIQIFIANYSFH